MTFPLALGAAIYTAFLFAQAEGRDLWQSSLLPFHLMAQAFVAGAGALLPLGLLLPAPPGLAAILVTGDQNKPTLPSVVKAVVGSARAAITPTANL